MMCKEIQCSVRARWLRTTCTGCVMHDDLLRPLFSARDRVQIKFLITDIFKPLGLVYYILIAAGNVYYLCSFMKINIIYDDNNFTVWLHDYDSLYANTLLLQIQTTHICNCCSSRTWFGIKILMLNNIYLIWILWSSAATYCH